MKGYEKQQKRILNLLKTRDWVSTSLLRMVAYQYNARIYELRKKGYQILSSRLNGRSGFRLINGGI